MDIANKILDDVQYLAVGHLSKDVFSSGHVAGGAVYYGAVTAGRLGIKPGILTSCAPDFNFPREIRNWPIRYAESRITTTFENIYGCTNDPTDRRQYVHDVADPISLDILPESWRQASILHLAPLLDEIPVQIIDLFPESLIVASIQGWTRRIGINGRVYASSWEGLGVLPRIDVAICSRQDAYSEDDIVHWSNLARVLIVTNGSHGVTVYSGERVFELESLNVTEIDPTGAGDVFSAAFAVRFFETGNLLESSDFASVVAGLSVRSQGVSAIPYKKEVELFRQKHL